MYKRRIARKMLASILIICMCTTDFLQNISIDAATECVTDEVNKVIDSKEDDVIDKTLNTTTFELADGQKKLIAYGYNVRYKDENGNLVDYEPELIEVEDVAKTEDISSGYSYVNKKGDSKQYLPERLTKETPILLQNDEYQVKYRPLFSNEDTEIYSNRTDDKLTGQNIYSENISKVEISSDIVENLYEDKEEINNTATYKSLDNNIAFQYISQPNGLKENIILNEKPESNVFSYEYQLDGLTPVLSEETNEIIFYNGDDEAVGEIGAPNMNDATGKAYSEDIKYQIDKCEENENTYIISMIIEEGYFESKEREYPIEIDPTVSWSNSSKIYDTYVLSGSSYSDSNFYSDEVVTMATGHGSQGTYRSYIKFNGLTNEIDNKYVSSAKLTLYETASSVKGQTVEAHSVTQSWYANKITWNNKPSYRQASLDTVTTSGTAGSSKVFDITKFAQCIANGTYNNYGLVLKNSSEVSGTFSQFYSTRNSNLSRRPKLSIVYYDGPSMADKVSVSTPYIKKGDKLKVSWEGIDSKALSYIQYKVLQYNPKTKELGDEYISYSSSTKIGTTANGTKSIIESADWDEGCYRIYVRGVDEGGIKSSGKGATFYIDGTVPTLSKATVRPVSSLSRYSNSFTPILSWAAEDSNFKNAQYSIDGGKTYKVMSSSPSGTYTIPSGVINKSGYYSIYIRVVDKAGNIKESKEKPYYFDGTKPVISASISSEQTSAEVLSANKTPTIKWSVTENIALNKVQYSINSTSNYTVLGTSTDGEIQLPSSDAIKQGKNYIYVRSVDIAGNYSDAVKLLYYYDGTAPAVGKLATNPSTTDELYCSDTTPVLSWQGFSDEYLKQVEISVNDSDYEVIGDTSSGTFTIPEGLITESGTYKIKVRAIDKAENYSEEKTICYYYDKEKPSGSLTIQNQAEENATELTENGIVHFELFDDTGFSNVKISLQDVNGDTVKTVYSGNNSHGNVTLSLKNIVAGKYVVQMMAVDKAGNVLTEASALYINPLKDYVPIEITETESLHYKTLLCWKMINSEKIPDNIFFRIYRGDSQEFEPSEENLIADNVTDLYYYDLSLEEGTYYYKIQAVKLNENNQVEEASDFGVTTRVEKEPVEITGKKIGENSYWAFSEFNTPNGSGKVERSSGNLLYKMTDVSLPNREFDFSITRAYNSQSDIKTTFGYGWDWNFNSQLYMKASGHITLKDSTGCNFEFVKEENGYKLQSGNDYQLEEHKATSLIVKPDTSLKEIQLAISYQYIITDKTSSKFYYNASGQLVGIVSNNGNFLTFEYDSTGNVVSIMSNGTSTSIKYADGLIAEIIMPDETKLYYEYSNELLIKVTYASADEKSKISYNYAYDENAKLSNIFDAEENLYQVIYNEDVVEKIVYPNGDNLRFTYPVSSEEEAITQKYTAQDICLCESKAICYLDTGFIKQLTNENGAVVNYDYNENGLIKQITTENSYQEIENNKIVWKKSEYKSELQYNSDLEVEKESERTTDTTSNDAGDSLGESNVIYSYEENDPSLPTDIIEEYPLGGKTYKTHFTYDECGNVKTCTDQSGNTTTYKYDTTQEGKLTITTETAKDGVVVSVEKTTYDENGNELEYHYSDTSSTTSEVNVYDNMGRVLESTDQRGDKVKYTYDFIGRVVQTEYIYKDSESIFVEKSTYGDNGELLQEVSKDGTVKKYKYDNMNRVESVTTTKDELSQTTTSEYTYCTEPIQIMSGDGTDKSVDITYVITESDTLGNITSVKYYDGKDQLIREVTDSLVEDYTYNEDGKVITSVWQTGTDFDELTLDRISVYLYDQNGNQTYTIENPSYEDDCYYITEETIVTQAKYDVENNKIAAIDGKGNAIHYEYDNDSNLSKVYFDNGKNVTTYKYDTVESLEDVENSTIGATCVTTTNALGNVSKQIIDNQGNILLTSDIGKDGNITTSYKYNSEGTLEKIQYSNGAYQKYIYDEYQRLKEVESYDEAGNKTLVTKYILNQNDSVIAMIDYNVKDGKEIPYRYTGYEYDALDRQTAFYEINNTDKPTKEQINQAKIEYTYDLSDNLTSVSYNNNQNIKSLDYTYDIYARVTCIKAILADGTEKVLREYSYEKDGEIKAIKEYTDVLGESDNYILCSYEYDQFDRIRKITYTVGNTSKVIESYSYQYDKNSNIVKENIVNNSVSENPVVESRTYTYYDYTNALKTSIIKNESGIEHLTSYQYDLVGNRTSMTQDGVVTNYTYNELNQLNKEITIDASGVVTKNKTYIYDKNGNTKQTEDTVSGEIVENKYDSLNRLISSVSKINDTVNYTQTNTYNGEGRRVSKSENGQLRNYYYSEIDGNIQYVTDGNDTVKTFNYLDFNNAILSTTRYNSENSFYYTYNKNEQQSTTSIFDSDNEGVTAYLYDDFGNPQIIGDSEFDNEIQYTSGIYDKLTGELYLNARYYDPAVGRFLTQDSYRGEKDNLLSWNLYCYCANNPVNLIDPSGHYAAVADGALLGAELGSAAGPVGTAVGAVAGGIVTAVAVHAAKKAVSKAVKKSKAKSKSKSKKKTKSKKKKGSSSSNHMLGENGTQFESKTTWQNGRTERIDVENPAPGKRPGQIHYHEPSNTKWYLDINEMKLYDPKTGNLAPKCIQKILKNKDVINAIKKGLKFLGE